MLSWSTYGVIYIYTYRGCLIVSPQAFFFIFKVYGYGEGLIATCHYCLHCNECYICVPFSFLDHVFVFLRENQKRGESCTERK